MKTPIGYHTRYQSIKKKNENTDITRDSPSINKKMKTPILHEISIDKKMKTPISYETSIDEK